jgi:hypothetical protein
MYRIINTSGGAEIGKAEKPRFIRKSSAGCYVEATEETAQGIAYKGTPYNLHDRDGVGADDTVMLIECDAGEVASAVEAEAGRTAAAVENAEDAMCDMDAANDERLTAVEDALCELDEAINNRGGENDE